MKKKSPKIICHMISTIDGRLLLERYSSSFDKNKSVADYDKEYHNIAEQELKCKTILNGRNTVVVHYMPNLFEYKGYKPTTNFDTFKAINPPNEWIQIILDPKGKTLYEDIPDTDHVITILSEQVSDEYLAHLREQNVSYIFAGKDGTDYEKVFEILYADFGIEKILLEGGGIINGVFLKAGLIDELSLTVYPGIDGSAEAPSIFEYLGKEGELPAKGQSLELEFAKPLASGMVWLYYKFHKK